MDHQVIEFQKHEIPEQRKSHISFGRLSPEANKAMQIVTGKLYQPAERVPDEFVWKNRGLSQYLKTVSHMPFIEHGFVLGQGRNPLLDGSDYNISNDINPRDSAYANISRALLRTPIPEKDEVLPLIQIHSHVPPLPADLHDFQDTTDLPVSGYEYVQSGMIGLLSPSGVSDLYYLDCYLMPKSDKHPSAFSGVLTKRERLIGCIVLGTMFPVILGSMGIEAVKDLVKQEKEMKAIVDGLIETAAETFEFDPAKYAKLQNERKRRIDTYCQELGIPHYRAAISFDAMKQGVDSLSFSLMHH